jgi:hypothetical protein
MGDVNMDAWAGGPRDIAARRLVPGYDRSCFGRVRTLRGLVSGAAAAR